MHGTLDLRRLRYFVAVAEAGSISGAARALNVAQPALSYHMAELERLTGLHLMSRGRDGVRLTGDGEVLRQHAGAILERVDNAERELARLVEKSQPPQRLRLAIITSLAADLTPLLVGRSGAGAPGPTLSIMEAGTREIEVRLIRGRIDMAVCLAPSPGIDATQVAREELLFVAPPGTLSGSRMPLKELADHRLVLPAPDNPLRQFIEASARAAGMSLDVVLEVDGPGSRYNAVVSGIGCTLLGAHSVPLSATQQQLCVVSIGESGLLRPIFVGRRKGLDPELAEPMQAGITAALAELGLKPPQAVSRSLSAPADRASSSLND